MGNANGSRKRPIPVSQDEICTSPERKRRRIALDSAPSTSSSLSGSTTNTMTSDDSTAHNKRRLRLAQLTKFLSLSSGRIDYGVDREDTRSAHSLGSRPNSQNSENRRPNGRQTMSCTSLQREWPTPWLEAIFLPEFPSRPSLTEKSFFFYEEIGRGSFGVVYRARLRGGDGRNCAIKIQEKSVVLMRDCAERAKREIEILKHLDVHPFIVRMYACWQSRSKLFTVLHYPRGGCEELFDLWRDFGPFSEGAVRLIGIELVLALDFLHHSSVIYRDLKMENVLVDGSGHVKIVDFGLAKSLKDGERTWTVCGTLQYMSPEVSGAAPSGYSHYVDYWSLAVLLHILLTNRYPYPNADCEHHDQLVYIDYSTPPGRSDEISNLFDTMLRPSLPYRLCTHDKIVAHPFFNVLKVEDVIAGQYPPMALIRKKRMQRDIKEDSDEEECSRLYDEHYVFNDF